MSGISNSDNCIKHVIASHHAVLNSLSILSTYLATHISKMKYCKISLPNFTKSNQMIRHQNFCLDSLLRLNTFHFFLHIHLKWMWAAETNCDRCEKRNMKKICQKHYHKVMYSLWLNKIAWAPVIRFGVMQVLFVKITRLPLRKNLIKWHKKEEWKDKSFELLRFETLNISQFWG